MVNEEITTDYINNKLAELAPNSQKLGDLTPFNFCQYCLSKLNGIKAYDFEVMAITKRINEWDREREISDETRVDWLLTIKKLTYGRDSID